MVHGVAGSAGLSREAQPMLVKLGFVVCIVLMHFIRNCNQLLKEKDKIHTHLLSHIIA